MMIATKDGSKTIQQMIEDHGVTVGGLAMLLQLAEFLELGPVTIDGAARQDTLEWLQKWREEVALDDETKGGM